MNIERLLKDANGTKVRLGATEYHFKPIWLDGPHVAPVEDEKHRDVFLSIPEGYREYDGPLAELPVSLAVAPIATAAIADLNLSTILTPAVSAPTAQLAPAVPVDSPDPDADPGNGNGPTGDDLARFEGIELTPEDDAALRALFKAEMNRVAPPKSKPETMIAQIRATREEAASEKKD